MKKILLCISIITLVQISCTKKFDDINTDPTRSDAGNFDPNLLLPTAEFSIAGAQAGYSGSLLFQSMWVQLLASTTSGAANYYSNGDKYVPSSNTNSYLENVWNSDYGAASRVYELQSLIKDKPELSNLSNIALIVQLLAFHNITDIYGDIPFSEALQAKTGSITQPKYDTQQSIYTSLLSQLDGAITALDASKTKPTNDVLPYKGDIVKWKKFGYSLMLKMAMRLTKIDAATAKTYAEKAAAGGTFASIDDNAYIKCDNANGFGNNNAGALNVQADIYQVRWSKKYIDYLKNNNDPRLGIIAEVPPAGIAGASNVDLTGDNTIANQLGLPNGYDLNNGPTDITTSPGYPGGSGTGGDASPIGKYSRPRGFYRDRNGPLFILTYAETELLLAEAAARGWNVGSTTAAQHYSNGVSGALQTLSAFGADATISSADADTYAGAHPLDVSTLDASLKQINEQYWATTGSMMNFVESWNNWKRSGYPVLTALNYNGNFSGGNIPRRQLYPNGEATLNQANYTEAATRLSGGDKWQSKVWWDQ